jgi:ATP/ADP translocase
MKSSRHLIKIELVALAALVAVALVLATYEAIWRSLHFSPYFTTTDAFEGVLGYALALGCLPVILFVAPLYSTLLHRGFASWSVAFVVGALPGAVLLLFSVHFGLVALACGAVIALGTHAVCGAGSNQSSKRTREKPRAA